MWGINSLQISERFVISTTGWGSYFFTSTTSQVVLRSLLIPANTFGPGDIIQIEYFIQKLQLSNISSWKLWINTSNILTGATQLMIRSGSANLPYKPQDRKIAIRNGNTENCVILNVNQGIDTDYQSAISSTSKVTIDWSVNQYLIVAMEPESGVIEQHRVLYIKVSN